ncbi:trihelix transcription factor GT-3b-like [Vicia villosa]|uniref:trihelix transcription factor GT-3b-like n=1 Tax=Vicia villosa TaxID=3911 RepID=UPI00273C45CF|nr:trihelix transcription factor GT-3b-like [Vicia villosa]
MERHQFQHKNQRQQQQHQQNLHLINNTANVFDVSDRFPQWSIQETKEFLMIRSELDQTFMETKRNKQLWDVISNHMKEKGYHRSAEQCKCKWKNLVTRYKGCETMETEMLKQQFPFYNELQAIFTARMQRMLWAESKDGSTKKNATQLSTDDEEDDGNEESEEISQKGRSTRSRKNKKAKIVSESGNGSSRSFHQNLKEILDEFMRQQVQVEAQWMEAFEARENERRLREMEWRQQMEMLENERLLMEQRWREREEERRIREEARADKRDALIIALLNKLERE